MSNSADRRIEMRAFAFSFGFMTLFLAPGASRAETVAQWDFESSLASSTGQAALTAAAASPAVAPSVTFADVTIAGQPARAAHFSRGTYFRARAGLPANGGGAYVNQYTLILDVMFPNRAPSGGWAALLQTSDTNANDGDWFINPAGGLGISGNYLGSVPAGEWHRLALVVDLVAGTFTSYLDGAKVQELTGESIDSRFALYSTTHGAREGLLLFADENGENAEGYVNAVQLRDVALCPEDMAALGSITSGVLQPVSIPPRICAPPPPPDLAIKEGPYLQWATQSEITVMWETALAADATVFYRRAGGSWLEATVNLTRKIHEIRLSGFSPGETVEYSVRSRLNGNEVSSSINTFKTNPDTEPNFNYVIWGDNHINPPVFSALVRSMVTRSPEVAVSCGDVVNTGSSYAEWGVGFLSPVQPLGKSVPFYIAIGNHEGNSHWFYDYFAQPGNEHWFSFDYAGCHFVIMDSNFPFGPGTPQYAWIHTDLFSDAAKNAKWLFTFQHHPPYSEVVEETIYAQVRMHLVPLFESAGVDMNFSGHIHDYERGVYVPPDTGRRIAYVQTSGAGGALWDDEFGGDWEQIEKVVQYVYHYCEVAIQGDTLTLRAIALDGSVIDSFTLTQLPRDGEPPPPPPPPAGKVLTQWDFDQGDLAATFGPGKLEFLGGTTGATATQTSFGTTESFGLPKIAGQSAGVMKFPKATVPSMGFRVTPNATPNADGLYVNEFTLLLDLLIPASSFAADPWLAFFQTSNDNSNDAEVFGNLGGGGGVGVSGVYEGKLLPNTWHRVGCVFQLEAAQIVLHKSIDGIEVGAQTLGVLDGRWSIYGNDSTTPWFLLFTDDSGASTTAFVSSVFFADRPLSQAEIAALGGAGSGGILADPCGLGDCDRLFVRGDANDDGSLDISDAVFTLIFLFAGGRSPTCAKAMDANDDGSIQVSDAISTLQILFKGTPDLKPPYPSCGEDPTADSLSCTGQKRC